MSTITLTVDDDRADELRGAAAEAGVSVEDYLRREIDTLMEHRRKVKRAIAETLREDAELYRRLAQ